MDGVDLHLLYKTSQRATVLNTILQAAVTWRMQSAHVALVNRQPPAHSTERCQPASVQY